MMQTDGRNTLITRSGLNSDLITVIRQVFEQYNHTAIPFVSNLYGCSFRSQCESVFWFVVNNITYKQDEGLNQLIKTPARLFADKVGDCKSMSIFVASCMYQLGARVTFRFVTFDRDYNNYTHVYCVASKDGEEYILDPVERVNKMAKFDYASKYMTKRDVTYTK